ncbi:MAG: DUF2934 domain-containing protein [Sphingomonas fennica]
MAEDRDEVLKARAYALWEEEGRPHGRDAAHWAAAEAELFGAAAADTAATGEDQPAAKPARKPRAAGAAPRRRKAE